MYDGNVRNRIRMANVLIRCVIFNLYVLWCRRTDDVVNKMRMANTTTIDFCVLEFPAKPSSANSIEFRQPKKRKKKKQRIKNRISCFFSKFSSSPWLLLYPRFGWHGISLSISLVRSGAFNFLRNLACVPFWPFEFALNSSCIRVFFFSSFFLCAHDDFEIWYSIAFLVGCICEYDIINDKSLSRASRTHTHKLKNAILGGWAILPPSTIHQHHPFHFNSISEVIWFEN